MIRAKLLAGALTALGLVVGLYVLNRYWIAPVTGNQVKASGDHPMAPNFSLVSIAGEKLTLAEYKGKVVMLDFWATWCGPCRIEIPGFVELQNRYRDQGFSVIGISMDDGPEPVKEFYTQFKMNYAVAIGDDKLVELFGGIIGYPTTFLIGRDGRIYARHYGATPISLFEEEIKTLLAAQGSDAVAEFRQAAGPGSGDKIVLGDPDEINSEVPGVNLTKLTAAEKEAFEKKLEGEQCTCNCKLNVLRCRREDRKCGVSRKLAQEELAKFLKSPA